MVQMGGDQEPELDKCASENWSRRPHQSSATSPVPTVPGVVLGTLAKD